VSASLAPALAVQLSRSRAVPCGLCLELTPTQGAASPACLPEELSVLWLFSRRRETSRNGGLQKEVMGEGEALMLVETALGQSRSLAKAWSCQPCAVKLWLFSGVL